MEQNCPDHYGTGRQPDHKTPYVAIVVTLLVVLLAANLGSIALLRFFRSQPASEPSVETATEPTEFRFLTSGEAALGIALFNSAGGTVTLDMELCGLDEIQQRLWSLPSGLFVCRVTQDGTADRAGVQSGDVVLRVNEAAVTDMAALRSRLSALRPGDVLRLRIFRNGEEFDAEVALRRAEPLK